MFTDVFGVNKDCKVIYIAGIIDVYEDFTVIHVDC